LSAYQISHEDMKSDRCLAVITRPLNYVPSDYSVRIHLALYDAAIAVDCEGRSLIHWTCRTA